MEAGKCNVVFFSDDSSAAVEKYIENFRSIDY